MSEFRLVMIVLCLLGGAGCFFAYKNSPANVSPASPNEWVPPNSSPGFNLPPSVPPPGPGLPELKPPVQPQQPKPQPRQTPPGGGCLPGRG